MIKEFFKTDRKLYRVSYGQLLLKPRSEYFFIKNSFHNSKNVKPQYLTNLGNGMQLNLNGKHEYKSSFGRIDNVLFNEGEMNKNKEKKPFCYSGDLWKVWTVFSKL